MSVRGAGERAGGLGVPPSSSMEPRYLPIVELSHGESIDSLPVRPHGHAMWAPVCNTSIPCPSTPSTPSSMCLWTIRLRCACGALARLAPARPGEPGCLGAWARWGTPYWSRQHRLFGPHRTRARARMWVDRTAEPGQVRLVRSGTSYYSLPPTRSPRVTNTDRPPRTSPASAPFNPSGPSIPPARHPSLSYQKPWVTNGLHDRIGPPPHCPRCPGVCPAISPVLSPPRGSTRLSYNQLPTCRYLSNLPERAESGHRPSIRV